MAPQDLAPRITGPAQVQRSGPPPQFDIDPGDGPATEMDKDDLFGELNVDIPLSNSVDVNANVFGFECNRDDALYHVT